MSNNHNTPEYNSIFSADNSSVFNNYTDNILEECKNRFNNATSLDEKYQTVQTIHNLLIKEFQKGADKVNAENLSNWLQELCANAVATQNQYIDIGAFKQYVEFLFFVFHFWNGIATWLSSKKNRDNKEPVEYPFFAGNMDCCKYYSEKILVWEHQQTLYQQFLYHALTRDTNMREAFKKSERRNERWRHNPLNFQ
jgi:hypothetical protein